MIREKLANYAHHAWSGWMLYLFSKSIVNPDKSVTIPSELTKRWMRQMKTDYSDLPEHEKESDRKEADSMLEIMMKNQIFF